MQNKPTLELAELAPLADALRTEIAAAKAAAASAVEHACRAGDLLIQAKKACPHGEWGKWLSENVDVSERTARSYMQLAKRWLGLSPGERQRVADLPLRQALAEGAKPSLGVGISTERVEQEGRRVRAKLRGLKAWLDVAEAQSDLDSLVEISRQAAEIQHEIAEHKLGIERELGRLIPELKANIGGLFPKLSSQDQTRLFNDLASGRFVIGSQPAEA